MRGKIKLQRRRVTQPGKKGNSPEMAMGRDNQKSPLGGELSDPQKKNFG